MLSKKERLNDEKECRRSRCQYEPQDKTIFDKIEKKTDPTEDQECQMDDKNRFMDENHFGKIGKKEYQ
jgi:hypothetical protein